MTFPFSTELYTDAISEWPQQGRHILASFSDSSVVVYQAYKASIADWAVEKQTFQGCPGFSMDRMTWIKPNFLWMMYRSGWATKVDQQRILAISVKKETFEHFLCTCETKGSDDVRLQWDPDHDPFGVKVDRRAIQLGIRGTILRKYIEDGILLITDVTNFVHEQYSFVQRNELHLLRVPVQRVYDNVADSVREHLKLDKHFDKGQ